MKRIIVACIFVVGVCSLSFAEPLTLDQSIKYSLSSNPQVISASEKTKAAMARLSQAQYSIIPSFTLSGSSGISYQQPVVTSIYIPGLGTMEFSSAPNENSNVSSYQLGLSQVIFAGGKVMYGMRIANSSYLSSLEDLRKAQSDAIYNTTSGYFDVLKSKKSLQIIDNALVSLNKLVKQSEIFKDQGVVSEADYLRANAQLLNMQVARIQAKTGASIAVASFRNLLGDKAPASFEVITDVATSEDIKISYEELLKLVYANRPEWRSFVYGKNITGDLIPIAQSDYLPSIFATGSTGRSISSYNESGIKYDLNSWRLMAVGSWNLNMFQTAGKVAEAQANYKSLLAQQDSVRNGLSLEAQAAIYNLEGAYEQVDAAKVAYDVARKALRFAEINYESQIGTSLSVIDAQTTFLSSENNYWMSIYNLELAKAKIRKVAGIDA